MDGEILKKCLELTSKPVFWAGLGFFFSVIFNFLLYRLNRKTFEMLYKKPSFGIVAINVAPFKPDGMGGSLTAGSYISVSVSNPSSFDNHCRLTASKLFSGRDLFLKNQDVMIPSGQKETVKAILDYHAVKNLQGKWIKIVLTDIRGNKVRKLFRMVRVRPTAE